MDSPCSAERFPSESSRHKLAMSGLWRDQLPPQMCKHDEHKRTVLQLSATLPEKENKPPEQMIKTNVES